LQGFKARTEIHTNVALSQVQFLKPQELNRAAAQALICSLHKREENELDDDENFADYSLVFSSLSPLSVVQDSCEN
jgi:hypothetical protein